MLSASELYVDSLSYSHRHHRRVTLFNAGVYVGPLQTIGGRFKFDGVAMHRRQLDFEVGVDPFETTSRETLEMVSSTAGELSIEEGVEHSSGTIEWVQTGGRLRITRWEREHGQEKAKVQAFDRTIMLEDDIVEHLTVGPALTAALDWKAAVELLVDHSCNGDSVTIAGGLPSFAIGAGDRIGAKPLDLIRQWCEKAGAELVNDRFGAFHLRALPGAPSLTPVAAVTTGKRGNLTGLNEDFDRQSQYNGIFLKWTDSDSGETYWGFEVDDDPLSPTFWDGPFGHRVKEIDDIPVTSNVDAGNKARAELDKWTGLVAGVKPTVLLYPLLEPNDTVSVFFPDTAETEMHLLESWELALDGTTGTMDVATRVIR